MDKLILILTALALLVALIPIYLSVRGNLGSGTNLTLITNNIFSLHFQLHKPPK